MDLRASLERAVFSFSRSSSSSPNTSPRRLRRRNFVSPVTQCPETVSAVELAYGKGLAEPEVEVNAPVAVIEPLSRTLNIGELAESASRKLTPVPVPAPVTDSLPQGVVVPMPTLPVLVIT